MIVIGLGAGRTGTASLAKLLSAQQNALCFHEMNPSGVRYKDTPQAAINMVCEFQAILDGGPKNFLSVDFSRGVAADAFDRLQKMGSVSLLGDIAHYHLAYVDDMMRLGVPIRFLCMRRDRESVVRSFLAKTEITRWPSKMIADRIASFLTRTPYQKRRNHWMAHDGSKWLADPVWDKVFPDFEASGPEEAIGLYWDYYYGSADKLAKAYPDTFRSFEVSDLNTEMGQRAILDFCEIPEDHQVLTDAHIHKVAT